MDDMILMGTGFDLRHMSTLEQGWLQPIAGFVFLASMRTATFSSIMVLLKTSLKFLGWASCNFSLLYLSVTGLILLLLVLGAQKILVW